MQQYDTIASALTRIANSFEQLAIQYLRSNDLNEQSYKQYQAEKLEHKLFQHDDEWTDTIYRQ